MPLFEVTMFGSSCATAVVVVEADNADAAQIKAHRDVHDGELDPEWEFDHVDALHAGEAKPVAIKADDVK